jgi:3-methyladenine DNA glycosylase AlkD
MTTKASTASQAIRKLNTFKNENKVSLFQNFFKTGPGQYGEGDIFIGVNVPDIRRVSKEFQNLDLDEINKLLFSKIHECRLLALIILVKKYQTKDSLKKQIFDFYIKNKKQINNWDLIDGSAPHIVGHWLFNKKRKLLYKLAKSDSLWDRRISVLSTFYFIRNYDFKDTLNISKILLNDSHDLIHKAVGWMLREMGNRDKKLLISFLDQYVTSMPRTMLRYAIEKLPEKTRKKYLRVKPIKQASL